MATKVVTFLSDFGLRDPYVAEVKAVLLAARKPLTIVDLCHDNPAFDIEWGAFQLLRAYRHFPPGTIHLAVVDPGVGTERRAVYIKTKHFGFVGPDNGILKWAAEDAAVREGTDPSYFDIPVPAGTAPTFHGRDVFAPFIGKLLRGKRQRLRRLSGIVGESFPQEARILLFDVYGNAVTSIPAPQGNISIEVKGRALHLYKNYQTIPNEECGVIRGSHGFLEIACRESSAKDRLGLRVGEPVRALDATAR